MLRRSTAYRNYSVDEFIGHRFVKQIRHRIYEVHGRGFAPVRLRQPLGMQGDLKAVLVAASTHREKASRHRFCVTVLASGRELRATSDRIPRVLGPLN